MTYSKWLAMGTIAAGLLFAGAAQAQDRYDDRYGYRYSERQDLRRDYARIERLRAVIAEDRYRLEENLRYGRRRAAERNRRDLARHQHELAHALRETRWDRRW